MLRYLCAPLGAALAISLFSGVAADDSEVFPASGSEIVPVSYAKVADDLVLQCGGDPCPDEYYENQKKSKKKNDNDGKKDDNDSRKDDNDSKKDDNDSKKDDNDDDDDKKSKHKFKHKRAVPNGCSGVLTVGLGYNFEDACNFHDVCYMERSYENSEKGRTKCDDEFYKKMAKHCDDKQSGAWRANCHLVAKGYRAGVGKLGKHYFEHENKAVRAGPRSLNRG